MSRRRPASEIRAVQLIVEQIDGIAVVRLAEAMLDKPIAASTRERLLSAVETSEAVLLDLSAVQYVDFFGFELILETLRRTQGRIVLGGVAPAIESIFYLSQLGSSIELFTNAKRALHVLQEASSSASKNPADREKPFPKVSQAASGP